MSRRCGGRLALAVWLGACVAAGPAAGDVAPGLGDLYPYCTEQVEVFRSLQHGEFDFCRLRLRYVPGSFDCLRIVARACNAWVPEGQRWVLRQGFEGRSERIVCPPGPPPPSCPAGTPMSPVDSW